MRCHSYSRPDEMDDQHVCRRHLSTVMAQTMLTGRARERFLARDGEPGARDGEDATFSPRFEVKCPVV